MYGRCFFRSLLSTLAVCFSRSSLLLYQRSLSSNGHYLGHYGQIIDFFTPHYLDIFGADRYLSCRSLYDLYELDDL